MKKLVLAVTLLAVMVASAAPVAVAQQEEGGAAEPEPDQTTIIGGHHVGGGEYPFIAALSYKSSGNKSSVDAWCGGSLIDRNSVLTAAHCMYKEDGSPESAADLQVTVGREQLSSNTGKLLDVTKIDIHPDYDSKTNENDVAVLSLSGAAWGDGISPAVLAPTTDDSYETPGRLLTVAGWGNTIPQPADGTSDGENYPDRMQQARVPVVSDDEAEKKFSVDSYVPSLMVAAGENGKDTCQGDSGGPLFAKNGSDYVVVGVTSSGIGCAAEGYPGKYAEANAPSIHSFITTAAGNNGAGIDLSDAFTKDFTDARGDRQASSSDLSSPVDKDFTDARGDRQASSTRFGQP
jgi:secreted trypsin-like serine protease